MDPTSLEVGCMGKGLTGIDSGLEEAAARREQPLKLVGPAERTAELRVSLLAAIHDKVIPELRLAHSTSRAAPPAPESMIFPSARAVGDLERALAFVDAMAARGLSDERVLVDLIVPAAVLLDAQFTADVRTALEVTLGKSLLQLLIHVLGGRSARVPSHRGLVMLVATPSERCALGIYALEEALRGAGWHVQVDAAMPPSDLVAVVESVRVETVGVSVNKNDEVGPLRSLIVAIRRASLNRDLIVFLAGSLADAESASSVGADHFSAGSRDAVRWLDGHVRAARAGRVM
jgi:methanogenic corrinoid protein MtbC1